MEHSFLSPFGDGGPPDDPFETFNESDFDFQDAENNESDEEEGLIVNEFRRLIEKFNESPINLANSDTKTIAKFVQWINYPGAEQILHEYGILQRYDNEEEYRIWIQPTACDFTKKSKFDVEHFRYMNCGKPKPPDKFLEKNKFLVNYWQIKEHPQFKLRKYYHPDLTYAVIAQYEEIEPPYKKQKTQHALASFAAPAIHSSPVVNRELDPSSSISSPTNNNNNSNSFHTSPVAEYVAVNNNYSAAWNGSYNNNNTNVGSAQFETSNGDLMNSSNYNYEVYISPLQTSSSQVTSDSPNYSNSTSTFEDPHILKEEFEQRNQQVDQKFEQINYEMKQTKTDVENLTKGLVGLSITTAKHDWLLEQHNKEILELNIHVNREICTALLTIFKQQSGYAPVGKSLCQLIRQLLDRTQDQMPNKQITDFVYVLVNRKIIRPRSPSDKRWELDVEMTKKYGLLK